MLLCTIAGAQQEQKASLKIGGFIRQYTIVDTRAVKAGTGDLYFYMPQDRNMQGDADLNQGLSWRSLSLTSRLWLDVTGYKIGGMNISGRVEADFYSLSGTSSSAIIPQLRLRQAFVKLSWDQNPLTLTMGQAWHPMAADMPHMTNLETGAPFNPFNRSPQIALDYKVGDFTITGSLLYLNHYLPTGPDGKSVDYYKYGFPELYIGAAYRHGGFLAKAGVDIVNTKPVGYVGFNKADPSIVVRGYSMDTKLHKASGILTAVSPFVFVQYTKNLFQIKAKAILAQSGEHMNLLSGYGFASIDDTNHSYTYTPMQDLAAFVSAQYGKKFQVLGMLGYMKQLGTTADLADGTIWLNSAADTRIQQAFRATPTVAWNIGKFCLSLEYNLTAAQFGNTTAAGFSANAVRNARGLYAPGDMHWVLNHRFVFMTKFTF